MYPSDFTSNIWNLIIMLSLMQLAMVLPITISEESIEEDTPTLYWINQSANYIFISDIFVNFFVAYVDDFNNLVDEYPLIQTNYMKTWFAIDFVSSIPFEQVVNLFQEYQQKSLKVLVYMKYLKMLRIFKIARMMKIFKLIENSET